SASVRPLPRFSCPAYIFPRSLSLIIRSVPLINTAIYPFSSFFRFSGRWRGAQFFDPFSSLFFAQTQTCNNFPENLTKGASTMATYVSLIQFTDQGIRNVKDTIKRGEAAIAEAEKMGM